MNRNYVLFLSLALLILLGGCDGSSIPLTDYQKGYGDGQAFGRSTLAEGEIKASMMRIGMAMRIGKIDESKSDDWNAGFLAGYKSVVDK